MDEYIIASSWGAQSADKIRDDARRYIDSLAERLVELESLARMAQQFGYYRPQQYSMFRKVYEEFTQRAEEFQLLAYVAEEALESLASHRSTKQDEYRELEENFRKLQVPMLRQVIRTNLKLLKVWDDRLRQGAGLPIGAKEVFLDSVRVVHDAKTQLLRPRYEAMLDDATVEDADRAHRLLKTLMENAPALFDFEPDHSPSGAPPAGSAPEAA